MRATLGARFRNAHDLDDHVRVYRGGEAWAACACDSFEFAFSAGWCAAGARLGNAAFARGWQTAGAPRARFDRAVAALIDDYRAAAPSLWQDDGFGPSAATATFLAICDDGTLHVRWIGEFAALLVRDRRAASVTRPHTLATELAKHGVDPRDHPQAGIITRTVGPEAVEADVATWERRAGDVIVIASGEAMLDVRADEIAAIVDGATTAQYLADHLHAEVGNPFGIAVAVIALD